MKFKRFWHLPNPLNVAVQTGLRSQSSWVFTNQLVLLVVMPWTCQYISSTIVESVDLGLHVAFGALPWYCITILSGVMSTGHTRSAPAEHRVGWEMLSRHRCTHIHYLNTTVPLPAVRWHAAGKRGNRKRIRKDIPLPQESLHLLPNIPHAGPHCNVHISVKCVTFYPACFHLVTLTLIKKKVLFYQITIISPGSVERPPKKLRLITKGQNG